MNSKLIMRQNGQVYYIYTPHGILILWFVLERSEHIEDETGRPDLNKLDMLLLKNRLDNWKKEVRLLGIKPLVYINYRVR